jgi:hypothetical protein
MENEYSNIQFLIRSQPLYSDSESAQLVELNNSISCISPIMYTFFTRTPVALKVSSMAIGSKHGLTFSFLVGL